MEEETKNIKKIAVVSACLVGFPCRWNGSNKTNEAMKKLFEAGKAVPICPEVLAGLGTPREPCEIKNIAGKSYVVDKKGNDCTDIYKKGAKKAFELADKIGATKAYLKAGSPTCGAGTIYDGTFTNYKIKGNGLFAELLIENNIEVEEIN